MDASFVKLHDNAKYEIGIAEEEEVVDGVVYRWQYWHGDGGVGEEEEDGCIIIAENFCSENEQLGRELVEL